MQFLREETKITKGKNRFAASQKFAGIQIWIGIN
jgi:hypothetical protein